MSTSDINIGTLDTTDPKSNIELIDTTGQTPQTSNIHSLISPFATKFTTNGEIKECMFDMIYLLSHIIFASVFVICLKNINPILLTVILSTMLGYMSYDEQHVMPIYTLFVAGFILYVIDLFIVRKSENSSKKLSILHTIKSTIWKLPFYGILSYYVILYVTYSLQKS